MYLLPRHIILSLIIGLLLSNTVSAQNKFSTYTADKYFKNTYYQKAIPIYEKYVKHHSDDNEAMLNLADSYYYTFKLKKASSMYSKLHRLHSEKLNAEVYYRMIQTLKALGKYDQAADLSRSHLHTTDQDLAQYESELDYLENVKAIGKRYIIKNLALNTKTSEFGKAVYQDSLLIFSANKKKKGIFSKIFHWSGETYLNLYSIPVDQLSAQPKLFSKSISTRFHESSPVFTKDGKTVFFTRNNYIDNQKNTSEEKVTHLQIYKAELVDGKWTNITSLPINSDSFSTEHPALSKDEKTLFFASNRPGGFGSYDLYQVNTQDFKNPENLGATINTKRREQFPFISASGHLYFSSNGHPGFGFLDVFISRREDGKFQKPDNIGLPVNSGYDDFAFRINTEKTGYFSSNRPSGQGSDDIYTLQETKELIIEDCYQWITGKTLHQKTKEIVPNATVQLSLKGQVSETFTTDDQGIYKFKVACEKKYMLTASKPNFQGDKRNLLTDQVRKKENRLNLYLISNQELKKIEQEKADKLAEKQKAKKQTEAERKAEKERLAKQKVINQEPNIVRENNSIFIKTEPIYFDYDLWYIRKESRPILNKVVDLMKKYPKMKIEIGTHTDIRGNKSYNKNLSLKRSNSVLDYLENQGIDQSRITAKGYGEEKPIIKCKTEDACTEEQHEINRRCEFKILSFTK